jgi:hypothetical protein
MGIFDIFKKNNDEIIAIKDLKLYNDDDLYYYENYSETVFNKIFIPFINFVNEKKKKIKLRSYKLRIDSIPNLPNEKIKYVIRITKEVLDIKTFVLYNLVTNIAYSIICEYSENHICSGNFIGDIQSDISLAFRKGAMDDIINNHGISYKLVSN